MLQLPLSSPMRIQAPYRDEDVNRFSNGPSSRVSFKKRNTIFADTDRKNIQHMAAHLENKLIEE